MSRNKEIYIKLMEKLMDEKGMSYEDAGEVAYYQLREALAQEYPEHEDIIESDEKDEKDWDDGQPDEAQEWHDFDPDC